MHIQLLDANSFSLSFQHAKIQEILLLFHM